MLGTKEGLISPPLVPLKPVALGRFAEFRRAVGELKVGVPRCVWVCVGTGETVWDSK